MKKILFFFVILLNFSICHGEEACSRHEPLPGNTFSFFFENDTFFGTDKEYTNGIRVSLVYDHLPAFLSGLEKGLVNLSDKAWVEDTEYSMQGFYLSFGQNIYTPEDTVSEDLVKEDRPYAGFSYIGAGIIRSCSKSATSIGFAIGMLGPHSYGEDVQKYVHDVAGWEKPNGWKNQLSDEPGLEFFYAKRWKRSIEGSYGFGFDLIPELTFGAGNIFTYAETGLHLRFGFNLPDDFGAPQIKPLAESNFLHSPRDPRLTDKIGFFIFGTASSAYVPRNIFLDGNTFEKSHSVEKYPVNGSFSFGAGLILSRFSISYARVFDSRRFKGQSSRQAYGTINITYSW